MINVGIIGCGFVGGALKDWLEHNNPECKLFISDPPKGYYDDLSSIDIAFLQIHVPTEEDGICHIVYRNYCVACIDQKERCIISRKISKLKSQEEQK